MPISDDIRQTMESSSSSSSTVLATSLLLATIFYAQPAGLAIVDRYAGQVGTPQTSIRAFENVCSDMDVINQLKLVYIDLVENQTELPTDERELLYRNLWDLYA